MSRRVSRCSLQSNRLDDSAKEQLRQDDCIRAGDLAWAERQARRRREESMATESCADDVTDDAWSADEGWGRRR